MIQRIVLITSVLLLFVQDAEDIVHRVQFVVLDVDAGRIESPQPVVEVIAHRFCQSVAVLQGRHGAKGQILDIACQYGCFSLAIRQADLADASRRVIAIGDRITTWIDYAGQFSGGVIRVFKRAGHGTGLPALADQLALCVIAVMGGAGKIFELGLVAFAVFSLVVSHADIKTAIGIADEGQAVQCIVAVVDGDAAGISLADMVARLVVSERGGASVGTGLTDEFVKAVVGISGGQAFGIGNALQIAVGVVTVAGLP